MRDLNWRDFLSRGGIRRIYCCGITPYDNPHIGHLRVLNTALILKKMSVKSRLVINWTDIDEKILRYVTSDRNLRFVSLIQVLRFQKILNKFIDLKPINRQPRVSLFIREILVNIRTLEIRNMIRKEKDGIYLRRRFHRMLGCTTDGHFALWKKHDLGFNSPYGKGIPGWHIECFSMINKLFDSYKLDLHLGGRDLIFPHHINEDLLSHSINRQDISRYWMHIGLINDSEARKMSKSLGNCIYLHQLLGNEIRTLIYLTYFDPRINIYYSNKQFREIVSLFNSLLRRVGNYLWMNLDLDLKDKVSFINNGFNWRFLLNKGKYDIRTMVRVMRLILPIHLLNQDRYRTISGLIHFRNLCRAKYLFKEADKIRSLLRMNYYVELIDNQLGTNFYLQI